MILYNLQKSHPRWRKPNPSPRNAPHIVVGGPVEEVEEAGTEAGAQMGEDVVVRKCERLLWWVLCFRVFERLADGAFKLARSPDLNKVLELCIVILGWLAWQ